MVKGPGPSVKSLPSVESEMVLTDCEHIMNKGNLLPRVFSSPRCFYKGSEKQSNQVLKPASDGFSA